MHRLPSRATPPRPRHLNTARPCSGLGLEPGGREGRERRRERLCCPAKNLRKLLSSSSCLLLLSPRVVARAELRQRQREASLCRCRSSARATTRGDRRSRQEEEERSFRRFFAGQQRRSRRRSRPSRPPGSKPRPEQGRAVFRWRGRGGVARDGRRCKEQRRGTNTREVQEKKKKNVIDFLQRKKKRG